MRILFLPLFLIHIIGAWLSPLLAQPRCMHLSDTLREISGLTYTTKGQLWALNDSQNPASLYLLDVQTGQIKQVIALNIPNRDWEDLASDPQGRLYLGDFGNNLNKRKDLCVFIYDPNLKTLDSILFNYADQLEFPPVKQTDWNFNCEAMIFWRDSLHIFSKNRFEGSGIVKHYVIPAQPGKYTAVIKEQMMLPHAVVTGASMHPDGRYLALCTYFIGKKWGFLPFTRCALFFFQPNQQGCFFHKKPIRQKLPKYLIARQYESVCFIQPEVCLVGNESRGPQKAALRRIRPRPN